MGGDFKYKKAAGVEHNHPYYPDNQGNGGYL